MFSFFLSLGLMHSALLSPTIAFASASSTAQIARSNAAAATIAQVPSYSQFADISSPKWQKVGCGITSLAMIIDYYKPDAVTVNSLLMQGIKAGAYTSGGWSHAGLVSLSKKYGLTGSVYDLSGQTKSAALAKLQASLADGPVIASVHYKFEPTNPIPHLVVVDGIKNGIVYYNDPAAKGGQKQISVDRFMGAWKKRYITIRPVSGAKLALALP